MSIDIKDPVRGMNVDPKSGLNRAEHRNPEPLKSVKPGPAKSIPTRAGEIYTCPMHPQIRQTGPGNCPICGMTLEPVKATAEVGENRELTDMTRRFWVGLALTLPVLVLEMGGHVPALGLHDLVPPRISIWIQFVLSTPVVLCAHFGDREQRFHSMVSARFIRS
jgi:Cu+-exporting ATPase